MSDSAYSFSLTTFSPSGKLPQMEHALRAVSSGSTSLGIRAKGGVVLATEKKLPALVDPASIIKITQITDYIGAVYAGLGPDARLLTRRAQKAAVAYEQFYGERIPLAQLVRRTAEVMQEFTQQGGVRPFGVSMLIGDETGLYQVDPSGSYWAWKASAIGKGMIPAKAFLEKRTDVNMDLEDAINTALLTLKEGFDGEMDEHSVEIGVARADGGFERLTP
eukprot:CAMPEP_0170748124 /NCGR_PEP_ID=MMETSP0437-20130122/9685_1 /TAXON_ID=0 /ORGANISM="Sexangularia sp." /LENGTH=219 /DNA_ID=CAMNT_0011086941 /DNA_START=9 /DNA_END=665 /DNA_ORIENTATION=-